jgi:hypothetical protein
LIYLDRFARANFWNLGFLLFHMFSMQMVRLFLNMLANNDFALAWLYILVLEHALLVAIFAGLNYLVNSFAKGHRQWWLVGVFAILGIVRATVAQLLVHLFGLENPGDIWFFVATSIAFELVGSLFWANVAVPYQDHKKLVAEVQKTREAILGYRENAEEILTDESQLMQQTAYEAIAPQIQKIEKIMADTPDSMAIRITAVQELKAMINNQVRPLSADLRQSARQLVNSRRPAPKPFMMAGLPPAKFAIPNSIFPLANYLNMLLVFVATPYWTLGVQWAPLMAIASVSYLAILVSIKRSLSPTNYVSGWLGYPALVLVSQIALLPSFAIVLILAPSIQLALVHVAALSYWSVITFGAFAFFKSLEFQRARYVELLEQHNQELTREIGLFEQKLWISRRSWSLTLHGTVQSALTAALTRFSSPNVDKKSFRLAAQDLERAMSALENPVINRLDLRNVINNLIATWRGVCDVQIGVEPETRKIIKHNQNAITCINEVLKECVSNAVRHGFADSINIQVVSESSDLLRVVAINNGQAPQNLPRKGMGSGIFDELTADWRLQTDPTSGLVVFEAKLPVATSGDV